ncbi:MAG: hypothetical protein WCJ35_18855, partial [Planctomycetota bacterium]
PASFLPFSPAPLLPLRRAYTLLEVILALSLAVVILGLVGVGIHVHLAVAAKSRDQVEEAQLARVLLQRIADDLRNAIPFQPATSSSSGTSSQVPLPNTSGSSDSTPLSGGICGTAQAIQIETARRPRATLASLQSVANDSSQPARLSDIRVVSYSLGAPSSVDMSKEASASTSLSGLYRHEQDRAEFVYGSLNGQVDESNPATELLAPEVVNLQLTYYGGTASGTTSSGDTTSGGTSSTNTTTNGTTSDSQWDSTQQGMLPAAVKISISLRRESQKSLPNVLDIEKRPAAVYSLLVSLPNASVDAESWANQQAETSEPTQADSTPPHQTPQTGPTNGRGPGGQRGQAQGQSSGAQGGGGNGKGGSGRGPGGQQGGNGAPGQGRFGGGGGRGGASPGGQQGPPSSGGPPATIPPGAGKGGS